MTDVQTRTSTDQHEEHGRSCAVPTRRAVLAGAGALGTTCLLAACGTDAGGGTAAPEPPAGSPAAPAGDGSTGDSSGGSSGGEALAAVSDVPVGGAVIKGDLVISQPEEGTFKAFSKVCTHQGCDVSKVDGATVICTCHNSVFSTEDGSPTSGPAKTPLKETQVKVDGDNIVAA